MTASATSKIYLYSERVLDKLIANNIMFGACKKSLSVIQITHVFLPVSLLYLPPYAI